MYCAIPEKHKVYGYALGEEGTYSDKSEFFWQGIGIIADEFRKSKKIV